MKKTISIFTDSLQNQIEYCLYGHGDKYLLCFPGFGETYENFENLATHIPEYTLVAINLYGVSHSHRMVRSLYLRHQEWQNTIGELLHDLKIDRFSVLGYSLGGRPASSILGKYHDRMDRTIFVAADGIVKRFTYQLATFPVFFRQLFYFLMKNPAPYILMVSFLSKIGLINSYLANFSQTQMGDQKRRMLIYYSWHTFKYLRLTNREVIKLIGISGCQVYFIFGKKDKIIDPRKHLSFLSRLSPDRTLVLPYGHNKLVDNSISEIRRILQLN